MIVVNVIRAIFKAQKENTEQQKERLRQPPPPRTQPGEKRADKEIEDFLDEISRGKGGPAAPRPAEQPHRQPQPTMSQPPQRPVPPIAHPVPPTVPGPIRRPQQQPAPQPATMRQPTPPPHRPAEVPAEKPRTVGAAPAPTSHPVGHKVTTAPAAATPAQPPRKKREYALEVAESLEVTHAEQAESTARFDELLPEDPLKKAIVLTELFGPCRAKKRLRSGGCGLRI